MSQNLPVNNLEWIKDTSQFNEDFIKNYNKDNDEGYFLKIDVQYLEKLPKNQIIKIQSLVFFAESLLAIEMKKKTKNRNTYELTCVLRT